MQPELQVAIILFQGGQMSVKNYREEILKTAGEIIDKQGLKFLTVENIVRKAKISKRSFYESFPTKEVLLEELKTQLKDKGIVIPDERMLLLKQAEEGIARFGFNNISLEAIATSAGLRRGAIYKYFADKYELLESCIQYQFENGKKIVDVIHQDIEQPDIFIRTYIESYCKFLNDSHESSLYTEAWSHLNYRKKIREYIYEFQEHIRMHLIKSIKSGEEKGIFSKTANMEPLTDFMLMTINGMAFFLNENPGDARIKELTVETVIGIFMKELGAEPKPSDNLKAGE